MNIRLRFLLIIAAVLVVTGLSTWIATETLIKSQYIKIENENVEKDTTRAVNAIDDRVDQLAQKIPDWSAWDDTYSFVVDKDEEYIESNLQAESLKSLSINFMMFFDENDELVFYRGIDDAGENEIEAPAELVDLFKPGSEFLAKSEETYHKGIIKTSNGPLMLASAPILTSDKSGPVRGTLVFTKYLTDGDVNDLGELTRLDVSIDEISDDNKSSKYSSTNPMIEVLGPNSIAGHQLVNDINDKPFLLATVNEPRVIFQETQRTLIFYLLVVMGVSLLAIIIIMIVTTRNVKQTKILELERASKKEIEKQVIDRTRQAEEEQARLRSAMDGLEVGLLVTFNDRKSVLYNPALVNIFEMKNIVAEAKESMAELTLDKLIEKISQETGLDIWDKIKSCQNDGKNFELKEFKYKEKTLHVFGAPVILKLDKIIGAVILIEDITESKVIERSKDEFFSIASHELRTPLTAIKGNSSMIMDYYKDILKDDHLKEMIGDIHESSVRLIEIVSDFLDVSRLEQGKMKFNLESVEVLGVIESVAKDITTTLNPKVILEIDSSNLKEMPKVFIDKNKFKQVVYNVLGNAAKFTKEGSIKISGIKDANEVEIRITDTGRGIAPELQGLLFHKFQQANESLLTRDTTKGTGLGLYISKMILKNMGGSIRIVETEVGKGTIFGFSVPIDKSQNNPKD